MDIHKNARSCPRSRALLVRRVLELGWSLRRAAAAAGLSDRRGREWLRRAERDEPMLDRSSRPHRSRSIDSSVRARILELRLQISHETIYLRIWRDKQRGGPLYKYLRQATKKARKRYGKYEKRGRVDQKRHISERPAIVESRTEFGHWEMDTMMGSYKCYRRVAVRRDGTAGPTAPPGDSSALAPLFDPRF